MPELGGRRCHPRRDRLRVTREWWVPGGVYRREVKRADEADARLDKLLAKIKNSPKP